jgi:type VII secretion integral membrane protein EccD
VQLSVPRWRLPGYPLIASWVGRMPVPELPDRPEQILADSPPPRRDDVFAAVTRSVELLTGMLLATAVVATAATAALLLANPGLPAILLCLTAATALLLRARLFPTPAQRVPLLASGVAGLMLLALGTALRSPSAAPRLLVAFGVIVAALVVLTAGLVYARRTPSPYIGRAADILDVVAIMALLPLGAWVLGVFQAVQGLFSSVGG